MTTRRQAEVELGIFDRLDMVIMRFPHVFGPAFLAGLALGLAAAADWWGGWAPWALTAITVVVVFLGVETIPRLPGLRERSYARLCWYGGGAWVVAAGWLGPGWSPSWSWVLLGAPPLIAAWAALLIFLWPPWFKHRRVRRGVSVTAEILAWDGDAVSLPGVELSHASAGADGDTWWATLKGVKGRHTAKTLRDRIPNIASWYEVSVDDVTIEKTRGTREGGYRIRVRQRPKSKAGVTYTVPDERPSLRKPFQIGHVNDGVTPLMSEVWRDGHGGVDGLTAGAKGYGKSTYYRRMAVQAIAARDALWLCCDQKPGSPDYRDLAPRGAYVYATDAAEIDLVIRALLVLCHVRGQAMRRDRKVLLLMLDETALYFAPTPPAPSDPDEQDPAVRARQASAAKRAAQQADVERQANIDRLVAISRAFDISIHFATQRGRAQKLGGADVRTALLAGQVCGFYSARQDDSALLSGDHDFDLSQLPQGVPGECLIANGIHQDVTRGSQHFIDDTAARAVVQRFADDQGDLHEDELKALRAEFGDEWDRLRKANRKPTLTIASEPEPEPTEPEPPRATGPTESRQLVWDALAGFDGPASVSEVAEAAGRSVSLTRGRLAELVEEGRATQEGHNRWTRYMAVR
ncbi:hypothetical protein [Pseudonocardia parietis]|uniref:FtsK domain-containing protein n=1 Tax=Pseudonocardia parietis TaxID=570936 RepID=A0ABS4W3I8_9PSEU|nr:hypothetical protein [Pseudonocardia parietis]MBP2370254.1 hypothetical protein [Pseudonocardia parietis]